jgi:hypothetical protein
MAVTKKYAMGLMKKLKQAKQIALTHPDADVKTTAAADIETILGNLRTAGVIEEG